jgi:hypothetical protein
MIYRYANMDYVFASVLKHHDTNLHKVVSYDIACQWSVNLPERLAKLPSNIRPPALVYYSLCWVLSACYLPVAVPRAVIFVFNQLLLDSISNVKY